jgi:transposase
MCNALPVGGLAAPDGHLYGVYYALEHSMECWLLNARHMANVPGRKTDVADAEWICQLVEHGLVRPSFVPPPAIRDIRELTRYRRTVAEERTREAHRLDKVLQDAGVKLSSVASDVLGMSARLMLDALIAGTKDPEVLADLAKGLLRKKLPQLREALNGQFSTRHAVVVGEILAHLDYLDESMERLSAAISEAITPFADARDRLTTIPGVDRRVAEAVIGEIGVDMGRFPTAAHLASWAGMCPGQPSPPASPAKAQPATATAGCNATSRWPPWPRPAAKTATCPANITGSRADGASVEPAKLSATPSSSPSGTSSRPTVPPTRTSALTGSTAATTPPTELTANSPNSAASAANSVPTPTGPPPSPCQPRKHTQPTQTISP